MNEKPMALHKRCAFIKADGTRCGGGHTKTSKYCFAHDPEQAEYRAAVASKAGSTRWKKDLTKPVVQGGGILLPADYMKLQAEGEGIEVTKVADLQELMNRLLTLSFSGKVNAQLVNSITNAIRTSAKLLELEVLEKRIAELESQLSGQG